MEPKSFVVLASPTGVYRIPFGQHVVQIDGQNSGRARYSDVVRGFDPAVSPFGSIDPDLTESSIGKLLEKEFLVIKDTWKNELSVEVFGDYIGISHCLPYGWVNPLAEKAYHIKSHVDYPNVMLKGVSDVPGKYGNALACFKGVAELKKCLLEESELDIVRFLPYGVILKRSEEVVTDLNEDLKSLNKWKKFCGVMSMGMLGALGIGSAVAAATEAPPVVVAVLTGLTAIPLGSAGRLISPRLEKLENALKEQIEIIGLVQNEAEFVLTAFDSIGMHVDKLKLVTENLLAYSDFVVKGDIHIDVELEKKLDDMLKIVHELSEHAEKCARDVTENRKTILAKLKMTA